MLRRTGSSRILFPVSDAHAGMMVTPSVRLVRPLGEGGMGSVWVADHLALRTQVVVKFIATELQNSREAMERFSREAAAAAQVKSPHVVQTFDHGVSDQGVPYIVMELLEGRDLGAHLDQSQKLSPDLVLEIVVQLARALERAHERGIVHRDIKPGNIFLCDAGSGEVFVKLLDFGIAKGVDVPQLDSHTKTGSMIGSPFYMSPEQILGSKDVDHRTDLWSVGVVAYEALTGKKPFDAETMGGLAIKIHSEPLPKITKLAPELPASIDAWFERACARNVDERFRSARELAEAFAAALGGQMPRSVDVPRISGPRVSGGGQTIANAPTLATTDAGLVSPARAVATRSKVLGVVAVAALGIVSFVAVRAIRANDRPPAGLVSEPSAARTTAVSAMDPARPTQASAAAPASSPAVLTAITPQAEPAAPPPVVSAAAKPPVTSVRPGPFRPRPSSQGATTATPPSLPSSQPQATPAPRPTSSGHDIF